MSRGKQTLKRQKQADSTYKSYVVTKMINTIMKDGKKKIARNIMYSVLDNLDDDKKEARSMLEQAVKNVMPTVEVRSRRIVGAIYQIPVPVRHDRAETLAIRWIVNAASNKKGKSMKEALFEEVSLAMNKEGGAMRKKEEINKIANANKAFSHFRF